MHEMSIAQSLIQIIREEMTRHNVARLKSVRLHIGQLSAVVPESLSFCFSIMTEGTALEGTELIMDIVPLLGSCRDCGRRFEIENYVFECPACKSKWVDLLAGQELQVSEMEVE